MKKGKKITLIAAGCMILVGAILALGGLAAIRFDLTKLNTISYDTNTYEIGEDFHSISIAGAASDVHLYPSQYDTCRVVCTESDDVAFEVEVKDDTLYIRRQDGGIRILYFGVCLGETGIGVYLPKDAYESLMVETSSGDVTVSEALHFTSVEAQSVSGEVRVLASVEDSLSIQTQSGDIHMGNASPKTLRIQSVSGEISLDHVKGETELQIGSTSGDVALANVKGGSLEAATTSGEIRLSNVILEGGLRAKSVSGDIELKTCDAEELYIQSTSGSVSGALLNEKVFLIDTVSGDVDVPHSASGGTCTVTTQSGDIDFQIVTE